MGTREPLGRRLVCRYGSLGSTRGRQCREAWVKPNLCSPGREGLFLWGGRWALRVRKGVVEALRELGCLWVLPGLCRQGLGSRTPGSLGRAWVTASWCFLNGILCLVPQASSPSLSTSGEGPSPHLAVADPGPGHMRWGLLGTEALADGEL